MPHLRFIQAKRRDCDCRTPRADRGQRTGVGLRIGASWRARTRRDAIKSIRGARRTRVGEDRMARRTVRSDQRGHARRRAGIQRDDAFAAAAAGQPNGHWPPPRSRSCACSASRAQGYHFPPEPDANYGYQQQQPAPLRRLSAQRAAARSLRARSSGASSPIRAAYDLGNYMPNGAQQAALSARQPIRRRFAAGRQQYTIPTRSRATGTPRPSTRTSLPRRGGAGRGRRWMFIVAALVGAVGVGGALAYTYKSFVAPNGGRVPLVKADPERQGQAGQPQRSSPTTSACRAASARTRGQQNTAAAPETQDERAAATSRADRAACGRFRLRQGGGPPAGIQIAPPRSRPRRRRAVPGHHAREHGAAAPAAAAARTAAAAAAAAGDASGSRRRSRSPPQQARQPPREEGARAAAPGRQGATPRRRGQRLPAAPPPARPIQAAGYVAVLSSQKIAHGCPQGLRRPAAEVWRGPVRHGCRTCRRPTWATKGIWYRVVVGPPGSRDAANGVCSQLKTAGYGGCWVNAY